MELKELRRGKIRVKASHSFYLLLSVISSPTNCNGLELHLGYKSMSTCSPCPCKLHQKTPVSLSVLPVSTRRKLLPFPEVLGQCWLA